VFEKVLASLHVPAPVPVARQVDGNRESEIEQFVMRAMAGTILIGMLIWAVRKVLWKADPNKGKKGSTPD
jgi:uncharacterized membrane protein